LCGHATAAIFQNRVSGVDSDITTIARAEAVEVMALAA